jgi:hypothetical protein
MAGLGGATRRLLFCRRTASRLPQSDTGAAAILVDELDARGLQGSSNYGECRTPWLPARLFELMDSHDSDVRAIG